VELKQAENVTTRVVSSERFSTVLHHTVTCSRSIVISSYVWPLAGVQQFPGEVATGVATLVGGVVVGMGL